LACGLGWFLFSSYLYTCCDGWYIDASNVRHGFVRAANGKITTFSVKKAGAYQGTFGITINTAGAIAGEYLDANNVFHGFVRAANGTITTFNVKKAGTGTYQGTVGGAINTAGDIAGYYLDAGYVIHGLLRTP
jgi:hypothetical protein